MNNYPPLRQKPEQKVVLKMNPRERKIEKLFDWTPNIDNNLLETYDSHQ